MLLPLGLKEITRINKLAHKHNLQTIADIKLNDIGNTNEITLENLWKSGFDAVIVNPIMGPKALKKIVNKHAIYVNMIVSRYNLADIGQIYKM